MPCERMIAVQVHSAVELKRVDELRYGATYATS